MTKLLTILAALLTLWAVDPAHLRPGQVFSVAAGQGAGVLTIPAWLTVEGKTGGPDLFVYQVKVADDAPLGVRDVVSYTTDAGSVSFVARVCCATAAPAERPGRVWLPLVRR